MGVSLSNHNPRVEDADFRFEITSGFKKQYANLQHFLQNVPEVTSLLEEPIKETGIAISVARVVNANEEAISAERIGSTNCFQNTFDCWCFLVQIVKLNQRVTAHAITMSWTQHL